MFVLSPSLSLAVIILSFYSDSDSDAYNLHLRTPAFWERTVVVEEVLYTSGVFVLVCPELFCVSLFRSITRVRLALKRVQLF